MDELTEWIATDTSELACRVRAAIRGPLTDLTNIVLAFEQLLPPQRIVLPPERTPYQRGVLARYQDGYVRPRFRSVRR